MPLNIECEERIMISEEQYLKILEFYLRKEPNSRFINQKNDYIDTPDLYLKNNHMVLRMRTIYGSASEFTLKIRGEDGDKEYNQLVMIGELQSFVEHHLLPNGEILAILKEMGVDTANLSVKTSLETRRFEEKEDDYLLVLDKNRYSDITDYNLEIEAPTKARATEVIKMFCEKYGLTYEPCKSKSRRALEAMK